VDGAPLKKKDLIKLNFTKSEENGDLVDPVTYKVFTDNTHIVAVRHGTYANVFAWDTVERMNVKAKMWRDLLDDEEFTRKDVITLQDPMAGSGRDLSQFKYLQDGEDVPSSKAQQEEEQRKRSGVNVDALGRMGEKVLRAKAAVEKARKDREAGKDVNKSMQAVVRSSTQATPKQMIRDRKVAPNAAVYTTGRAAASFTSTGLTPETSAERALLTDEEYMLKPRRVKIKGFARVETNFGDLSLELHTDTAPKAVWNFVRLAQKGYYRGVVFHRNIPGFMIQGGDPTGTGRGGTSIWGKNFDDEFEGVNTHSDRGVVSMANKGKNTNSSQFFVTYKGTPHLDRKHTVFGKVVSGHATLDKMERVPTDSGSRPLEDIRIKDVVVYLDPFEEFLKQRADDEKKEKKKEAVRLQGGTADDRTTWTGKRIRDDGSTVEDASGVGRYLKTGEASAEEGQEGVEEGEAVSTWEAPARKKAKMGGFQNFDAW